jgi:hypothetical protein
MMTECTGLHMLCCMQVPLQLAQPALQPCPAVACTFACSSAHSCSVAADAICLGDSCLFTQHMHRQCVQGVVHRIITNDGLVGPREDCGYEVAGKLLGLLAAAASLHEKPTPALRTFASTIAACVTRCYNRPSSSILFNPLSVAAACVDTLTALACAFGGRLSAPAPSSESGTAASEAAAPVATSHNSATSLPYSDVPRDVRELVDLIADNLEMGLANRTMNYFTADYAVEALQGGPRLALPRQLLLLQHVLCIDNSVQRAVLVLVATC